MCNQNKEEPAYREIMTGPSKIASCDRVIDLSGSKGVFSAMVQRPGSTPAIIPTYVSGIKTFQIFLIFQKACTRLTEPTTRKAATQRLKETFSFRKTTARKTDTTIPRLSKGRALGTLYTYRINKNAP